MNFRRDLTATSDLVERVSDKKFVGFRTPKSKPRAFDTSRSADGKLKFSIRPDAVRRIVLEMVTASKNG